MIANTTTSQDLDLIEWLQLEEYNFGLDAINAIEWVRDKFEPDDIFLDIELHDWAIENGYVLS